MNSPAVLLTSSDRSLIESVGEVVASIGPSHFEAVADVGEACRKILGREAIDVVLIHLRDRDNTSVVSRVLQAAASCRPSIVTIVLAEEHHPEQALALIKLGAADCLCRPLDLGRLAYLIDLLTIGRRRHARTLGAAAIPAESLGAGAPFLFVNADRLGRMVEIIRRIAPLDTTVVLGGETGTGKTRLAEVIHGLSPRRDKPFLTVNCGTLAANLIESEMFGHARGAFTGADAERVGKFTAVGAGTLFLDEIDSLPLDLQVKLLRAVEERAFEPVGSNRTQRLQARLIVASNRPLEREVAAGRFRADLYYRLNVVAFEVPPLRERKEVITSLARLFVAEFSERHGRAQVRLADDVEPALLAYSWPGNIRELRNVMERAVALAAGPWITLDDLPEALRSPEPVGWAAPERSPLGPPAEAARTLGECAEHAETQLIARVLQRNGNNRRRAAAELGISRMTLYNKLRRYGLIGV